MYCLSSFINAAVVAGQLASDEIEHFTTSRDLLTNQRWNRYKHHPLAWTSVMKRFSYQARRDPVVRRFSNINCIH